MDAYVPIEDVNTFLSNSIPEKTEVDRYHLELSENVLTLGKGKSKAILITNIGWDTLKFEDAILIGSGFSVSGAVPDLLLPGKNYPLTVTMTASTAGTYNAGLYVDVGNSYGNKFVKITGVI